MKLPAKFQPYRDKRGDWRWRVRAGNGKILADSGEGYRNWDDLFRAAYLVSVALAVECLAEEPASPPRRRKPAKKAVKAGQGQELPETQTVSTGWTMLEYVPEDVPGAPLASTRLSDTVVGTTKKAPRAAKTSEGPQGPPRP